MLEGASRYGYESRIRAVLRVTADPERDDLLGRLDALCDTIDAAIRNGGLAHLINESRNPPG